MNIEHYLLKTSYCRYYARIEKYSDLLHKVYVGGRKKCVAFSVYIDGESHPNLDTWSYNNDCNVEGNLEQGRGSLHLLKTACSFIKAKYGHSKIEFIEKSYVMCSNNWRMPLCYYYLVKHGKTWYEEKLGAHPESIKAQQRYRDEKQKLMASLTSLDKPSFKTFASDYNISKKLSESLKDIYDSSKTLKGFFKIIFDKYDCGVLKGWFVDFVSDYTRTYGSSWIFDVPSDDTTMSIEALSEAPKDMFIVIKTPHNTSYGV